MEEEEETVGVSGLLHSLIIETARTEEEAVEQLEDALEMEVKDKGEGKEGGDGI